MKRILSAIAAVLVWVGAAVASGMQPAELPPDDFTARQYIDSRGCVFLRGQDQEWRPRLYRGEEMVCGFPPTLTMRPLAGDRAVDLSGPTKDPPVLRIEQALGDALFPYLREGERVGDSAPFRPMPDMGNETVESGPADLLQAEIAAQSAVRFAMAGARQPNRELCRWLGYDGGANLNLGAESNGLGHDPTQGFCNNLASGQVSRLVFARPAQMPDSKADKHEGDGIVVPDHRPAAAMSDSAQMRPPAAKGDQTVPAAGLSALKTAVPRKPAKPRPNTTDVGMIPAKARYVQVGVYDSPDQALGVVLRLSSMGLPVLRQVSPTLDNRVVILSGPFASRQGIVIALDRIKSAGFLEAVPR